MLETLNIVKKGQVRLSGVRLLEGDSLVSAPSAAASLEPQCRIVENKDQLIVIEITCECGKKMYLHCDCREG